MNGTVICTTCGKSHLLRESELTFQFPDVIFALSSDDRAARCDIDPDVCALDRKRFFVRGLFPLAVTNRKQNYNVGVWAEVSEEVFGRIYRLWDDPSQSAEPRMSGSLANKMPFHSDTVGLDISIQLTGPTSRPEFYVNTVEHSLYAEQSRGIDEHRAIEYSDREARDNAV
jgi:hypothetical protein